MVMDVFDHGVPDGGQEVQQWIQDGYDMLW